MLSATSRQAPAVTHDRRLTVIPLARAMPGMDGMARGRLLRTDPRTAAIPSVVTTVAFDALTAAGRAQAADLLAKPFDVAAGYAVVKHWSEGHR